MCLKFYKKSLYHLHMIDIKYNHIVGKHLLQLLFIQLGSLYFWVLDDTSLLIFANFIVYEAEHIIGKVM